MVFGLRERGRQADGPFDHKTGTGWVKARKGHYHDAIAVKRLRVILILVEALGGITPRARSAIYALAERVQGKSAIDRTKYGRTRASPRSFFVHHTQQLTTAAVIWDAKAIRKAITHERQKLMGAQAPPGATA